jgi:hypothetical protein
MICIVVMFYDKVQFLSTLPRKIHRILIAVPFVLPDICFVINYRCNDF